MALIVSCQTYLIDRLIRKSYASLVSQVTSHFSILLIFAIEQEAVSDERENEKNNRKPK